MKSSKKFKVILMILICVLIILIGFLGIYSKKGNVYKNKLPDYIFASDIKGATVLQFKVDDSTDTIYYDKDGNKVDSEEVTEENKKDYKKEEVPVNSEESLTKDNYKKVVSIMNKRLKLLNTDQYRLDLNEKTGDIFLTFEDDYPEDVQSFLQMVGKLELVDSKTEEVILTYTDFNSAEVQYYSLEQGYEVHMNLILNKSGLEKIKDIDKYKTVIEDTKETNTEVENEENLDTDTEAEETAENKFKIMFDTEEIKEVSYDDILLNNNTLRIITAKELTKESEINSEININGIVTKLATIGKMPVEYKIELQEYVNSSVIDNMVYVVTVLVITCLAVLIYFIVRYRAKGILVSIAFMANIAIFLIIIRLTRIQISLNGIVGVLGLISVNIILINNILDSIKNNEKTFIENIKTAYFKSIDSFVISLIIFVVFAFSSMTVINSMGLLVFWGWLVTLIGNLVLTVPMLAIVNKK